MAVKKAARRGQRARAAEVMAEINSAMGEPVLRSGTIRTLKSSGSHQEVSRLTVSQAEASRSVGMWSYTAMSPQGNQRLPT